jgi:cold shock CspA family protein
VIGKIKSIKPSHYGFLLDEDGKEYFFHADSYKGNWEELVSFSPPITIDGPIVQFKPITGSKGLKAIEVELVEVDE